MNENHAWTCKFHSYSICPLRQPTYHPPEQWISRYQPNFCGAPTIKNLFPRLREEVEAIGSIRFADIYLVFMRMKPPVARSSVPPEEFMCAVAAAVSSASLP